ncbi:MAG: ethanolamine ammonia-lyase subunit EutC [Myxococcaceae bacterium]|nr:ethanolamine ammonia-lyase subunit EutC [Myxococcaceae bacterium]
MSSAPLDTDTLTRLVREAVVETLKERGLVESPTEESPVWSRGPKQRPLPAPKLPSSIEKLKRSTPSRIVQGRTGTRYLTESYLGLREDHATALDAVHSAVPEDWPAAQGWLALKTRCQNHEEFLLHPDHGRRLDEASRARCEKEADHGVDIQIIAGDGLSAMAVLAYGPALVKALQSTLPAAGFRIGKPLFVRQARIGVQDDIGVLTGAKATLIIVGERPGLGTGDSLSIYTAYGPKLGQDNAEKDCISNVRALGFPPEQAAVRCAELFKRTFAAQGGGVKLI